MSKETLWLLLVLSTSGFIISLLGLTFCGEWFRSEALCGGGVIGGSVSFLIFLASVIWLLDARSAKERRATRKPEDDDKV